MKTIVQLSFCDNALAQNLPAYEISCVEFNSY